MWETVGRGNQLNNKVTILCICKVFSAKSLLKKSKCYSIYMFLSTYTILMPEITELDSRKFLFFLNFRKIFGKSNKKKQHRGKILSTYISWQVYHICTSKTEWELFQTSFFRLLSTTCFICSEWKNRLCISYRFCISPLSFRKRNPIVIYFWRLSR